jgi:hypothetical protein
LSEVSNPPLSEFSIADKTSEIISVFLSELKTPLEIKPIETQEKTSRACSSFAICVNTLFRSS